MSEAKPGGWGNFQNPVTPEAMQVFNAVHNPGIVYVPFAYATQIVAGTNYCFLCTSQSGPTSTQGAAKVYIYAPLPGQGNPEFENVVEISPAP